MSEADHDDQVLLQVEMTAESVAVPTITPGVIETDSEVEFRVRELQHRLKNGIQMMIGTLDAARRRTVDESARLALASAMQQVQAIAHVQSIVTEVLSVQTVPAQQFLQALCDAVRRSLSPEASIHCTTTIATLPAAVYTHVALIINELVTNAVKYGVSDAEHPIEVGMTRADDKIVLSVSDHGPQFDVESVNDGTGLGLVRELVRQLGGTFTMTWDQGTCCAVQLPELGAHTSDQAETA